MKLIRRFTRTLGHRDYYAFQVTIPPDVVKRLGWKEDEELDCIVEDGLLLVHKA